MTLSAAVVSDPDVSGGEPAGVAWIGGVGAEAGLGAAVARRFARGGLRVVLTGRSAARIESVAESIRAAGGHAHALPGDLASPAQLQGIAQRIRGLGPVKAAVFNAGSAVRTPTLQIDADQFTQVWRNSTLAGFLFAREALALLLDNGSDALAATGRGSLLITGATASLRGRPPFAAFAAAKAGLRSLGQTLAREFGPQGVHVAHVVIDGGIDGERLRNQSPERAAQAGEGGLLQPDAIAESYWQLHAQHRSAWTQELDLRPFKEPF